MSDIVTDGVRVFWQDMTRQAFANMLRETYFRNYARIEEFQKKAAGNKLDSTQWVIVILNDHTKLGSRLFNVLSPMEEMWYEQRLQIATAFYASIVRRRMLEDVLRDFPEGQKELSVGCRGPKCVELPVIVCDYEKIEVHLPEPGEE